MGGTYLRIIPTHMAKPGMRLGRAIYDPQGRLVIAAGVTLQPRLLSLLERQGFSAVYVADEFGDVDVPELVSLETKQEVMRCVRDFVQLESMHAERLSLASGPGYLGLQQQSGFMISKARHEISLNVMKVAEMLVNDIMSQKEVIIGLVDIKSLHDYSFGHSVQVAMNSLVTARIMGFNNKELRDLGGGALLHDIGKTAIPNSIWAKPGDLTIEEFTRVRDHPQAGFETLRKTDLGLMAAHIAYQHHERWDGSGYPRRLSGGNILKHARICAVCDVFDAMTSDRPYKKAAHPLEGLAFIAENAGILFDPEVVEAFSKIVAPFPVATSVILSTGETAIVRRLNPRALDRPVVVITKDAAGNFYSVPRTVDLQSQVSLRISSYADWYSAPDHSQIMAASGLIVEAVNKATQ